MKPVLFVTGHVPASRRGAFEALGEQLPLTLALFGGPHQHGAPRGRLRRAWTCAGWSSARSDGWWRAASTPP